MTFQITLSSVLLKNGLCWPVQWYTEIMFDNKNMNKNCEINVTKISWQWSGCCLRLNFLQALFCAVVMWQHEIMNVQSSCFILFLVSATACRIVFMKSWLFSVFFYSLAFLLNKNIMVWDWSLCDLLPVLCLRLDQRSLWPLLLILSLLLMSAVSLLHLPVQHYLSWSSSSSPPFFPLWQFFDSS